MAGTKGRLLEPTELARQAAAADQAAAELEHQALHEDATVDPAAIDERQRAARHLRFRQQAAANHAERERIAKRLRQLADLSGDILAFAAVADPAPMRKQLAVIAAERAKFTAMVNTHNDAISGFKARADALGVSPPAPGGPKAEHGGVAMIPDGVAASHVVLRMISGPDDLARIQATPIPKPDHVFVSRSGAITTSDGPLTESQRWQISRGDLAELGGDALAAWWGTGTLDRPAR